MDATQNKIAPLAGKGEVRTTRLNSTKNTQNSNRLGLVALIVLTAVSRQTSILNRIRSGGQK
jgi:hypothetical protein